VSAARPPPRLVLAACALLLAGGCFRSAKPDVVTPRLTLPEVTALVPAPVEDREGWALDLLTALAAHHLEPDAEAVCEVLAVVEQESGFKANPPVANLSRLARDRLDAYASKLGPLGPPALRKVLEGRAPGTKATFDERLDALRTERDLDLLFRDLLAYYEHEFPGTYRALDLASELSGRGGLDALDPITTAGSMQVSVRDSVKLTAGEGLDEWRVRDRLYTRAGGLDYGTARLLGYTADYDRPLYRFADYNAGVFAARNAAFQEQLGLLMHEKLVLDGDLLLYGRDGEPDDRDSNTLRTLLAFRLLRAPDLSERRIRRDARLEKTREFEETDTWRAVKAAVLRATGAPPAYARMPDVVIRSPKMAKEKSTAWYANAVDARYQRCRQRAH
jgi:hypothetical protein